MLKTNGESPVMRIYGHKGNIGSIIHNLNSILKQTDCAFYPDEGGNISEDAVNKQIENIDNFMNDIKIKCEALKEEAKNIRIEFNEFIN